MCKLLLIFGAVAVVAAATTQELGAAGVVGNLVK
jgi:hypothetical protein